MMKRILFNTLIDLLMMLVACGVGFYIGRKHAYQDFQSEKCWIHKDTNDVVCIAFIE
jgi:hypothetical protein